MTRPMTTDELVAGLATYGRGDKPPALSLPLGAYSDAGFFDLEQDRIFRGAWICVAHGDSLRNAGDFITTTIASEPVIVVRGVDGALRALSNVCRHRFHPVAIEPSGNTRRLTCLYHRWSYQLDGSLFGAPYMESNPDFDRSRCALPSFRVETWLGFVFVNLDADARPVSESFGPVAEALAHYRVGDAPILTEYRKVWNCNWKLALENASESYHHFSLHENSGGPMVPTAGTRVVELTDRWATHETALGKGYEDFFDSPGIVDSLDIDERTHMRVYTMFPAFVLLTAGKIIQALTFRPQEVGRVELTIWNLLHPDAARSDDLPAERIASAQTNETVLPEDEAGLVLVQNNARSRVAERGWLSDKEGALVGFYRYLACSLAA